MGCLVDLHGLASEAIDQLPTVAVLQPLKQDALTIAFASSVLIECGYCPSQVLKLELETRTRGSIFGFPQGKVEGLQGRMHGIVIAPRSRREPFWTNDYHL